MAKSGSWLPNCHTTVILCMVFNKLSFLFAKHIFKGKIGTQPDLDGSINFWQVMGQQVEEKGDQSVHWQKKEYHKLPIYCGIKVPCCGWQPFHTRDSRPKHGWKPVLSTYAADFPIQISNQSGSLI